MINKIAVLGAGTMGRGIAETFALCGYRVNLYEPFDKVRESVMQAMMDELSFLGDNGVIKNEEVQMTLSRILLFKDLREAVKDADYVIEATPENIKLKQDLFKKLDIYCNPETILASNTSS